jgi:hypothetical protein
VLVLYLQIPSVARAKTVKCQKSGMYFDIWLKVYEETWWKNLGFYGYWRKMDER